MTAGATERMTDFESVMWELERDPRLASSFANLTFLDRPPDHDRLRRRMERAVRDIPRLRQRVVPAPAHLGTPEWRDDPGLDLDRHLRRIDLGGDATTDDVLAVAAELSGRPFDREHPLWEFVTIEGLADGRAAMVQRMHHTVTDGVGGIRLSASFLDLERDPADPGDAAADDVDREDRRAGAHVGSDGGDDWLGRTSRALGDAARRGVDRLGQTVSGTVDGVGELVRHPGTLPRLGSEVAETARSALRQARVDGRRSPLWTERSLRRRLAIGELDLAELRAVATALGGSVNDVVITIAADAAGRAHRAAGRPVDELRVSIPVSTRAGRGGGAGGGATSGGNAFSPTQALVPTDDRDPAARFAAVHAVMDQVKGERSLGLLDGAAAALNLLPGPLVVRAGQHITGSVDFVCSNVRAAPFDLYLAGALIEANHPIGPLAGTAWNLTVMSYRGRLYLGMVSDAAAVDDPTELVGLVLAAYGDLRAAAGVSAT